LDYGKLPLNDKLNQRCGIKDVVIFLTNITEESLFKNSQE
jgi:hypothetical protein